MRKGSPHVSRLLFERARLAKRMHLLAAGGHGFTQPIDFGALPDRLRRKADGRAGAGAVDILVTGCEVSLWLGEQFAADLSMMFKKLHVRTLSSNKLLGLLGQDFPIPQTGHAFSEDQ